MSPPSEWIRRWTHLLEPGCTVLDLACGSGRHLAWFAAHGHAVTGVDRDIEAARGMPGSIELLQADLEAAPWPLRTDDGQPRRFGAVVVCNYLWRPLLPQVLQSLLPGGLLLYETFATGNASVGRPARADFLLQPAELLQLCAPLNVVAYECGTLEQPARYLQRIAAVNAAPGPIHLPLKWPITGNSL